MGRSKTNQLLALARRQLSKVTNFARTDWFIVITLLLFTVESAWLAINSLFPMAFDEGYHFGVINFFSGRSNPIITSQPESTYRLGAIAHNPSFLYHYLLSFPNRLFSHFGNQAQIIDLRLINVLLGVASLFVFWRILKALGLPRVVTNLTIMVFALTPIVPVLFAQINYDNLLILMSALAVLLTINFIKFLDKAEFKLGLLVGLISLCLFASLVKFSFLPIFIGVLVVVGWQLAKYWRQHKNNFWQQAKQSFVSINVYKKLALAAALLIGLTLFISSYGYDVVRYHNPQPSCDQVLSLNDCKQYYAWDRNHTLAVTKSSAPGMNIATYSLFWAKVSYYQLFAGIVPSGGLVYINPLFYKIIICLTIFALVCTLFSLRKILSRYKLMSSVLAVSLIYILFLWGRNYQTYLHLGQPVAIQGRYLLPVLIYFLALFGLGIHLTLKRKIKTVQVFKPAFAAFIIASFVLFGGFSLYVSKISPYFSWNDQIGQLPIPKTTNLN